MTHRTTLLLACLMLAACGDPLDRVQKLSDVTLAENAPTTREAVATPEELARNDGGIFGGLFSREPDPVAPPVTAQVGDTESVEADAALAETAVSTPEGLDAALVSAADLETNSDAEQLEPVEVEVASLSPADTAATPQQSTGLFGLFRRAAPQTAPAEQTVSVVTPEVETDPAKTEDIIASTDQQPVAAPAEATPEVDPVAPQKRRGILSGLFRTNDRVDVAVDPEKAAPQDGDVVLASVEPELTGTEDVQAARAPVEAPQVGEAKSRGLFGARSTRARKPVRTGPDAADVTFGTVLPFGQIARVCDAKGAQLGKQIEKAGRGKGFALYDSAPETTTPRTFYVTGFDDGCARQFTAALALFGSPTLHEQLRYGRPSEKYPYSTTDKAYEKVKAAVCKVARRAPCGARIETLERDTVFISTYERFTDNGRWADILLHDGTVLAAALKDL